MPQLNEAAIAALPVPPRGNKFHGFSGAMPLSICWRNSRALDRPRHFPVADAADGIAPLSSLKIGPRPT